MRSSNQTRDPECFADRKSIPWNLHTIFLDCNSTADVPSFTLRAAPSAIPFVCDLCGVDVQWFQERSSQALPNSKQLSVYMTLGFHFGSKNFCKLLSVSWEVFLLHGYDWIHWVAKSCTTTAYRWLFRDSHPSLTILWSAAIKSPKFSALVTTVPVRLLHGALVILVLWQISQFRSLGKWVSTLCLPKSALLAGSEDGSWEELVCESLCSGTLSSTRFSLNSCSLVCVDTGSPVPDRDPQFYLFWILVGYVTTLLIFQKCLSIHTFTWLIWMINFQTWRSHGCWGRRALKEFVD